MIRYRNQEFKDYFINPYTAVITDINGATIQQYLHHDRPVVRINGEQIPVYCIQAHTYYGWRPDKVVHHIDGNHYNDTLFNLWYEWTQGQHVKFHKPQQFMTDETWENIGAKLKGRVSPFKGCSHTEEANEKNRIAHTGKVYGEETRKKHSLKTKGNKWWHKDGEKSRFCKEKPGEGWELGRK